MDQGKQLYYLLQRHATISADDLVVQLPCGLERCAQTAVHVSTVTSTGINR